MSSSPSSSGASCCLPRISPHDAPCASIPSRRCATTDVPFYIVAASSTRPRGRLLHAASTTGAAHSGGLHGSPFVSQGRQHAGWRRRHSVQRSQRAGARPVSSGGNLPRSDGGGTVLCSRLPIRRPDSGAQLEGVEESKAVEGSQSSSFEASKFEGTEPSRSFDFLRLLRLLRVQTLTDIRFILRCMALKDALLPEFDHEMGATRRVHERVPVADLAWKPHDKSFSLGQLAAHVANIPHWIDATLDYTVFDLATIGDDARPKQPDSIEVILNAFDDNVKKARAKLDAQPDGAMLSTWTMKNGDHEILTMPKVAVFRSFIMNHLIHHRGQLTVYLRLRNVPLPALYGPTADEG